MRAARAPEWRNRGGVKRRVPERGKSAYEIRTLRHDFVLSAHDRPGRRTSFVPTDMMNHHSGIQPNTQTASPAQPYHFHTDGIVVLGTGLGDAFVKATNASRFQTRIVPLLDAKDGGPTAATQIHNKLARFRAMSRSTARAAWLPR